MLADILCALTSFFFNDTATTEIYTLSLHDALPIYPPGRRPPVPRAARVRARPSADPARGHGRRHPRMAPEHPRSRARRSEEHTSELQSQSNLVCRLLLEKKKTHNTNTSQKKRSSNQ